MKIKKTVSEKVIAANQRNAQKSPGPKDVSKTRYNAIKHGLLARGIVFRDEEEKSVFLKLVRSLEDNPRAAIHRLIREDLATSWWNLQRTERELGDIQSRQVASSQLLRKFISNSADSRVSILAEEGGDLKKIGDNGQLSWDCSEVVLRAGMVNRDNLLPADSDQTNETSMMEVRLTNRMEIMLRYQASLKRDFYRALQMLVSLED